MTSQSLMIVEKVDSLHTFETKLYRPQVHETIEHSMRNNGIYLMHELCTSN